MKCPECGKGEVIVKKTSRGKRFFGCSRYPKCKWASWRNPKAEVKADKPPSS
jgi:DNA topoisomerase-1